MEDKELASLEAYVLSSDRQSQLESFVPGTFLHYYFSLTQLLAAGDLKTIAAQDLVTKVLKSTSDNAIRQQVNLTHALKRIELETDPAALKKQLESFNSNFLHYNFNYAKPSQTQSAELGQDHLPSVLPPIDLPWEAAYTDINIFNNFAPSSYYRFDVSRFSENVFLAFVVNVPQAWFANAIPRLAKLIASKNLFSVLSKATLAQVDELLALEPDLVKHHQVVVSRLSKKFPALLESDPIEPRDLQVIYLRFLDDIVSLPESYKPLQVSIRRQLLLLGLELGQIDHGLFEEYLKAPLNHNFYIQRFNTASAGNFSSFYRVKDIPEQDLLQAYFDEIFRTQDSVKPFDSYVEASLLNKVFARARIYAGVPASKFADVLSTAEVQSLIEKVEVEFTKSNPKSFARAEAVVVQVELKNVQRLIVRLFELNTKTYYLKHHAQIKTDIDLEGLVPSTEQTLEFDASPLVRNKLELNVPGLENKAGIFVLELIGNGRSTRALIKKGSLKCVTKLTAGGHILKVLDESNSVCKEEGAGVYLDGRFYSTNNPSGQVTLPFAQSPGNKQLILTDGVFSELFENFSHQYETYELRGAIVIPQESCLKGTRAKIAIKPQLFVNSVRAPNSLLSNINLTIDTVTFDNLPSSKHFPDLVIPEPRNELIELEFEVPANSKSVSVSLTADVQPISRRAKETLTLSNLQELNSTLQQVFIYSLFLRLSSEGYLLEVRGRDGALKDGVELSVLVKSSFFNSQLPPVTLRTEGGVIRLGFLEDVEQLAVRLDKAGRPVLWNLNQFKSKVNYPNQISLCEGDEFSLPVASPLKESELVQLLATSNESVLGVVDKVLYNAEAQQISLSGLEKGSYRLNFQDVSIPIKVYEGSHWGQNQFILTESSVIETPSQYRSVAVKEVNVTTDSLQVQLNGDFSEATVHLYLFSFLSNSLSQHTDTMNGLQEFLTETSRTFPHAQNIYLSSRLLDEELRYAIERKQQEKVVGNTLPRPQLALKRQELGATKTETQTAAPGSNYASQDLLRSADMHNVGKASAARKRMGGPDYAQAVANFTDFLARPAVFVSNLPVNEHGVAELTGLDLSGFSAVQVIAVNSESVAQSFKPIDASVSLRSLAHKLAFDLNQTYAEQLKSTGVRTGEDFTVKDAANRIKVLDSVDKQLKLLNEVAKTSGKAQLEWKWLSDWDRLSAEEKAKKYDEFTSHELNLFLYNKDPSFFAAVVRPFLNDKFEKTFVDKWLLEEPLEEYLDSFASLDSEGTKLNALELALLVKRIRSSHPEEAAQIVRVLEEAVKAKPRNEEERRRIFNTVLNFELKEDETEDTFNQPEVQAYSQIVASGPPPPGMYMQPKKMAMFGAAAPQTRSISSMSRAMPMAMNFMAAEVSESTNLLDDFDISSSQRQEQPPKPYYEKLDATKEYAETHYYGVTDLSKFRTLLPISEFYAELASAFLEGRDAILSESFLQCTRNPTDSYAALTFTDLPFRPAKHGFTTEGLGYTLSAKSNFIVFHKVLEAVEPQLSESLLVAQKYFDPDDLMYTDEDGELVEKPVKQFLKDKVYGVQVILSNTSSKTFNADVLAEIPEGALPVVELDYSSVKSLSVGPYGTANLRYQFYFPEPGTYRHFPANVAVRGVVKAVARTQTLTVLASPSLEHLESFKDIVASGNTELILKNLSEKNLFSQFFALEDVLWLARDLSLYKALITLFRQKRIFDARLWAFSAVHSDLEAFRELLNSREDILKNLSLNIESGLVSKTRKYRHLDYFPLVNARAHKLGTKARITNTKFKTVYKQFLIQLAEKATLEPYDLVALAHYWVLQDRLSEAKQLVDSRLSDFSSLQLDYIRAYLDLPNAGEIAKRYTSYPVKAWRDLFAQVETQLAEAAEVSEYHEAKREDEPDLSFSVEQGGIVKLVYTGLTEAWLSLYEVDLEVLFCRNPFFSHSTQDFSFVTPNFKSKLQLDPDARRLSVTLPEQFSNKNVLVEIEFKGIKKTLSHFATSLNVQVLELYGQVKVASPDFRPLPLTYVKAFAKLKSGASQFYKDGYTDIRGRFDFVSLNTDILKQVERFALFIEHEQYGSLTVEASPPPQ